MGWCPNEYDARQCERMKKQMLAFDAGELDLGGLVRTLEALFATLEGVPEEWAAAFQAEWESLELVYSDALDQGKDPMPDENATLVRRAISRLHDLLTDDSAKPS